MEKLGRDTVCRTSYDIQYTLKGDTCFLIHKIDSISNNTNFGIAINYPTQRIARDPGAAYSPPYLGNIDSIADIKIELITPITTTDITNRFHGDSSIHRFLWKDKGLTSGHIISGKCCYKTLSFQTIGELKNQLNKSNDEMAWQDCYEYFFWLNTPSSITFNSGDKLKLTTISVDSLNNRKIFENIIPIKKK